MRVCQERNLTITKRPSDEDGAQLQAAFAFTLQRVETFAQIQVQFDKASTPLYSQMSTNA
jgi:hypothetical protein